MKMGTIASLRRYDVAAAEAIRPDNLRRTAILRYASWAAVFRMSRVARLPFDGRQPFRSIPGGPIGPFQASQSHNRNRRNSINGTVVSDPDVVATTRRRVCRRSTH